MYLQISQKDSPYWPQTTICLCAHTVNKQITAHIDCTRLHMESLIHTLFACWYSQTLVSRTSVMPGHSLRQYME